MFVWMMAASLMVRIAHSRATVTAEFVVLTACALQQFSLVHLVMVITNALDHSIFVSRKKVVEVAVLLSPLLVDHVSPMLIAVQPQAQTMFAGVIRVLPELPLVNLVVLMLDVVHKTCTVKEMEVYTPRVFAPIPRFSHLEPFMLLEPFQ